jgi:hypothetical protein
MQARELIARSLGQHFDAAVMIVTDPSGDAKDVCLALDEPAKANALHASANDEASSLDGFFRGAHVSRLQSFKVSKKKLCALHSETLKP